jgi:polysaccharide pyruvyl transferase WcaK-like protein
MSVTTSATRIGVFGLFGAGNLGNDGSLEAMLRFLRAARPHAQLTCICADPVKIEREHNVRSIRIGGYGTGSGPARRLLRLPLLRKPLQALHAFRTARKLDVMLIPGTGILDDFGDTAFGMPIALYTWCLAARVAGTRIAFVSVGAGPIMHPVSRRLMKAAARMAHYRSYRDTVSKTFMESIGFDTRNDPMAPDIAFGLPAPPSPTPPGGAPITVGVGVMAYYGWRGAKGEGAQAIYEAYLSRLTRFVLWLLDRGHAVRVLTGEHSDWRAVTDLKRHLAASRPDYPRQRIVAEPVHSLYDLMQQIAETQVVVATRFHNIVCALKMGRPCISLGYAKKNDVLMADMGLGDFCQHVESLDLNVLTEQFTRVVAGRSVYEQAIREKGAQYTRRLAEQERVLLERFLGEDGRRAASAEHRAGSPLRPLQDDGKAPGNGPADDAHRPAPGAHPATRDSYADTRS